MKLLKVKLADGNVYTFTTFSILEQKKLKADHDKLEEVRRRRDEINFVKEDGKFKLDENKEFISRELTDADNEELKKIQDLEIQFMMNLLRKSLCKSHPEFAINADKDLDNAIQLKLEDLVDMDGLQKYVRFAFSGVYLKEESVIDTTV